MHLKPFAGAERQLEMPSVIGAAGTPPKGRAGGRQPQVVGVVVDGHQLLVGQQVDGLNAGHADQVRHGVARREVVLRLDLDL